MQASAGEFGTHSPVPVKEAQGYGDVPRRGQAWDVPVVAGEQAVQLGVGTVGQLGALVGQLASVVG